ncbi:hypothetical protein JAAARDRAFT_109262, partial [Jaapia argillacea MUCL 33604]
AKSTTVECILSNGCQLLHFTCNCLSPLAIRALICLGMWGQFDLLYMSNLLSTVK